MPPHIAKLFVDLGDSLHTGALLEDYERHQPHTMGKTKLEEFAKEFAAAYKKA